MGFSAFPEPAGGSVRPAADDADVRPSRLSGQSGTGCVQAQGSDLECGNKLAVPNAYYKGLCVRTTLLST